MKKKPGPETKGNRASTYYLAVLLDWSEIRMPGLLSVAEPLLRLLATRARRKDIEKELEARYCYKQRLRV